MKAKYLIIALTGVALLTSSCKKFLDQNPNSLATDQTIWKTDGDANASVAGCYSLIRSALNTSITHFAYGDLVSDEFTDVVGGDGAFRDVFAKNWGVGIPFANNWDPRIKLRVYTNFYAAIAQSNRCLYFIDKMLVSAFSGSTTEEKQKRKNHYLGEAYFTRAFTYFYMVRIWGDVPLVTEHLTDPSSAEPLARTPKAQVLAKALADLQQAKTYLDWKDNGAADRVVRADKGAVNALLAHIYAWQGKYDDCAAACDAVIQSGSYSLVDAGNYMSIYQGRSTEGIFELAASPTESQIATDAWSITGVTLTRPYIEGPVVPAWQINSGLTNWLYSNAEDVRFKKAFVELNNNGATVVECIKYANIQNINNNPANQIAINNLIVFRLADILLLKAEALAAKTTPDPGGAMALVNQVRANRGLAADPISGLSGKDLLYAITDERGRELFLEGQRYFDLVRLERLTAEEQIPFITHAEFTAGKHYWPLDPTLFLTNSKLAQTPFWQDKMK